MRKAFALTHRQRLRRRLEGAWNCFIVDGLAARSRGARGKCKVADGDALEVPELAILSRLASTSQQTAAQNAHMAAAMAALSAAEGGPGRLLAPAGPCYVAGLRVATLVAGARD